MKRLAVLGHPVSHSRSPAMQTAALEALGLAGEWSYEALDLSPEELATQTKALPEQGFVGANVTIPHKQAALALADEASDAARRIGAANTLSFGTGRIRADNTDTGLLAALPEPVEDARRSSGGRRVGTRRGLGAGRAGRLGLGLEPHAGAGGGAGPRSRPRSVGPFGRAPYSSKWRAGARKRLRADHQLHGDRDARRGPVRAPAARSRALERGDRARGPGLLRLGEQADRRGPRGGARRRSAAWRSWSARAGSRCESGRVWIHRWRSCARQRSEQGSPDFRRARAHAYRATR